MFYKTYRSAFSDLIGTSCSRKIVLKPLVKALHTDDKTSRMPFLYYIDTWHSQMLNLLPLCSTQGTHNRCTSYTTSFYSYFSFPHKHCMMSLQEPLKAAIGVD